MPRPVHTTNYYRDYDPATGRYIPSDPIGLQGGFNTYAYALNNPLGLTDPLGLDSTQTTNATGESPDRPNPDSEQAYTDKLTEVFKYAHEKLKNTSGAEVAAQFVESLIENAAVVAVIVVAFEAANAAGFGTIATGILASAGFVLAGFEAGRFLVSTIELALALRNTDLCDAQALKAQGDQLADSVLRLGTELASSALLGGLGKVADAVKAVASFAGQSTYRIYRRLRDLLRRDTPVARLCSFAGDTLVVTDSGYQQLQNIVARYGPGVGKG